MNESTFSTNSFSAPLPWQLDQWSQLSRAFAAGQMAHAYLLAGSEGLGKSLFAESFARTMLCLKPTTKEVAGKEVRVSCGECANCQKGGAGNHPDIVQIEVEEGSKNIKIDQIRWLSEFVIRSSHSGAAKVAIIQDAHLLNGNAANALLKTLEEPNKQTHLLLVSDHPGRLVATVRSRCQKLNFQTPKASVAKDWLEAILGGSNIEALLEASEMRPLTALRLAGGDWMEGRAQFLQCICDMKLGKKSTQQALALTPKIGESDVLLHLSAFLSKLIKYCLTGSELRDDDPAFEGLYTLLKPSNDKQITQSIASSLALFYSEVELARKQLASASNPNPQLIMESILWRWSQLELS